MDLSGKRMGWYEELRWGVPAVPPRREGVCEGKGKGPVGRGRVGSSCRLETLDAQAALVTRVPTAFHGRGNMLDLQTKCL